MASGIGRFIKLNKTVRKRKGLFWDSRVCLRLHHINTPLTFASSISRDRLLAKMTATSLKLEWIFVWAILMVGGSTC